MRNALLNGVVIMFVLFCAACSSQQQANSHVSFIQGDKKIDVMLDGKFFTSYWYDMDKLAKPVLFPVQSPSGTLVTRMFPFEKVEGESNDHPHHYGIFFTYDDVNGTGFWNNTTFPPQIRHNKVIAMDPANGTLCTEMFWVDAQENPLLKEERCMVFSKKDNANCVDMTMKLIALDNKVVFGDTKEGMFAIRVAHWLKEQGNDDSEYLSSNGDKTEKNIWGTRAKWVKLEGKKDNKVYGIIIMDHPESTNYPTYWHARSYGLFSANPLGQSVFQEGRGEKPEPFNLTLQPGESAVFHYTLVVYENAKSAQDVENLYQEFIQ